MAQVLGAFFGSLIGYPNGVTLAGDKLGQRLIERDSVCGVARNDQLWLQAAFLVYGKKSDDRGVRAFSQEVQCNFQHAVRISTAQQFDAELIEQDELLDLLGAGQAGERVLVRFLHGDWQVLHDRLHKLRIVALRGGRLLRLMECEFGRADLEGVAVDDRGLVNFLAVHERAVAAVVVANDPAIGSERERGVDARAERVWQRDMAIRSATDERLTAGIEGEVRASAVARQDRQIGVESAAGDRHTLPGKSTELPERASYTSDNGVGTAEEVGNSFALHISATEKLAGCRTTARVYC